MDNVEERLDQQIEIAEKKYFESSDSQGGWFMLAAVAVRALVAIASYCWDFHAESQRNIERAINKFVNHHKA